jgi:hypothetical protein
VRAAERARAGLVGSTSLPGGRTPSSRGWREGIRFRTRTSRRSWPPSAERSLDPGRDLALSVHQPRRLLAEIAARLLDVRPRLAARMLVRMDAGLGEGRSHFVSQTENLSEKGMLVRTPRPLPVGTTTAAPAARRQGQSGPAHGARRGGPAWDGAPAPGAEGRWAPAPLRVPGASAGPGPFPRAVTVPGARSSCRTPSFGHA